MTPYTYPLHQPLKFYTFFTPKSSGNRFNVDGYFGLMIIDTNAALPKFAFMVTILVK